MTKDAEALLCICYHDYLERVKSGQSKTESRCFSEDYIHETASLSSWHEDDFYSTCSELQHLHPYPIFLSFLLNSYVTISLQDVAVSQYLRKEIFNYDKILSFYEH